MIDWITFRIWWDHPTPLEGGRLCKVDQHGVLEWESKSKLSVSGSHESSLLVQTVDVSPLGHGQVLLVHGNPVKWLQGHNLWGTDDVRQLVADCCHRLAEVLDLPNVASVVERARAGAFQLSRVDITYSWDLGSTGRCLAWLREAEYSAHMHQRGRGQLTGQTLYFGKHSRRWALKIYSKGHELKRKGHQLPDTIPHRGELLRYAEGLLRVELVMRSMELKRLGLSWGDAWDVATPQELHRVHLEGLNVSGNMPLGPAQLGDMKPAERAVYEMWRSGMDLREVYPKATFYRYRSKLRVYGVDIATAARPPAEREGVALLEVLTARPVGVPEWALAA